MAVKPNYEDTIKFLFLINVHNYVTKTGTRAKFLQHQ